MSDDFDAAKRVELCHHGRKIACPECVDEDPAVEYMLRGEVIGLRAKVREQAEEIAHLRDRDKLSDEAVAALTTQRNAMAEEIERLKVRIEELAHPYRVGYVEGDAHGRKDAEAALAAEREASAGQEIKLRQCEAQRKEALVAWAERERAEKMTSECQLWMDTCRNAEERAERLEQALRSIATNTCCDSCQEAALVAREALRPAAPEAKESDCTCGEQWPCPLHGGPPAAPEPTPSKEVLSCHCTGDGHKPDCAFWMSLSEQPDLPLGHEFVAGHPHPAYQSYCALRGIFGLCGQPESAHRGKP